MIVETSRFGVLEVDPAGVITLPRGMIGFPESQRFILLEHAPGQPFQWLQSLDDPHLAFVMVDPYAFFPDYALELSDEDASLLNVERPGDVTVLTTVTIRRAAGEVTTNLLGPLVVGVHSRRAAQLVLNGDRYTTRHPLPPAQSTAAPPARQQGIRPLAGAAA